MAESLILKKYSVILTTSFYGMNQKINEKCLFTKLQLIPILRFQVMHVWLCVFHCSHRLLCWIKSRIRDFLWKLLSFHTEMISASHFILKWFQHNSSEEVYFFEEGYENMQKNSNFKNFESTLCLTSGSMSLSVTFLKVYVVMWAELQCNSTTLYPRYALPDIPASMRPSSLKSLSVTTSRLSTDTYIIKAQLKLSLVCCAYSLMLCAQITEHICEVLP